MDCAGQLLPNEELRAGIQQWVLMGSQKVPRCPGPAADPPVTALWFRNALQALASMVPPRRQLPSLERGLLPQVKPSQEWTAGEKTSCERFLPRVSILDVQQEAELSLGDFHHSLSSFQTGKSFWVIEIYSLCTASAWENISMTRSK